LRELLFQVNGSGSKAQQGEMELKLVQFILLRGKPAEQDRNCM